MRKGVPCKRAQVGHGHVAGIQQANLHQLIRQHIRDDLRAGFFPWWARVGEGVFNDPLQKRFGHHGPGVLDAEVLSQLVAVGIGRGRRDAVDHAVGKGDVVGDPAAERRLLQLCQAQQDLAQDVPIALEIVAGHDGKGGKAVVAPAPQPCG